MIKKLIPYTTAATLALGASVFAQEEEGQGGIPVNVPEGYNGGLGEDGTDWSDPSDEPIKPEVKKEDDDKDKDKDKTPRDFKGLKAMFGKTYDLSTRLNIDVAGEYGIGFMQTPKFKKMKDGLMSFGFGADVIQYKIDKAISTDEPIEKKVSVYNSKTGAWDSVIKIVGYETVDRLTTQSSIRFGPRIRVGNTTISAGPVLSKINTEDDTEANFSTYGNGESDLVVSAFLTGGYETPNLLAKSEKVGDLSFKVAGAIYGTAEGINNYKTPDQGIDFKKVANGEVSVSAEYAAKNNFIFEAGYQRNITEDENKFLGKVGYDFKRKEKNEVQKVEETQEE